MKRDEMHIKGIAARKAEKSRIKQVKEMTKNHLFISVDLLQPIHDPEVEWKRTNEIWLAEQEKKDRKKRPRLEKAVDDEEDDDLEIVIDKFRGGADFIAFEDEDESKNEQAGQARQGNLRTNHSIEDEFLPGDFFDDMKDEDAIQALYN